MLNDKTKLQLLNELWDYSSGSLWWGREDIIMRSLQDWRDSGREGHPLLSIGDHKLKSLFQAIPMLAGCTAKQTNKNSSLIIEVEEGKATDFSTGSAPVFISGDDFLFHSGKYDNEFCAAVYKRRFIWPVFPKKRITEEEHRRMEKFLSARKNTALNRKGWN